MANKDMEKKESLDIIYVLQNSDTEMRIQTIEELRKNPFEADIIAVLSRLLLEDASRSVRWRIAELFRQNGSKAKPLLSALIKASVDEDHWVRWHAIKAIREITTISERVLALTNTLSLDENPSIRSFSANELGRIGSKAKEAESSLIDALLNDKEASVRSYAAKALGQIGSDSQSLISGLVHTLETDNIEIQAQAIESLGRVGLSKPTLISSLIRKMESQDLNIRILGAIALAKIGVGTKNVVLVLIEALEDQRLYLKAWNALLQILKEGQNRWTVLLKSICPKLLNQIIPESIAQGVLPSIGLKVWDWKAQIHFPEKYPPYTWSDKGVHHSWETHKYNRTQCSYDTINQVCIHSDWFPNIHLIAVAQLILFRIPDWSLEEAPATIEGEQVGFILQSGGKVIELDGMRHLIEPYKTDRIDFLFSQDLRMIQYLMFAGISAQIPPGERRAQEIKGSEIWSVFTSRMKRILLTYELEDVSDTEWFCEEGWQTSRYGLRYERRYIDIQECIRKLFFLVRSDYGKKLKRQVAELVTPLLNELELTFWFVGLKEYPDVVLRTVLPPNLADEVQSYNAN
jgi:HEAT repeat protein